MSDVAPDDLPFLSTDERKVSIGWDTRTWSKLWVYFYFKSPMIIHFLVKSQYLAEGPLSVSGMLSSYHKAATAKYF